MTIANRHSERDLFQQLFLPDAKKRILTIRGDSGWGKTNFITHCLAHDLPDDIDKVFCQLKGGYVNPAEIFSRFVQYLQWDETSTFTQSVPIALGVPSINIEGNWLIGFRQQITVHLNNFSPQERKDRIVALTDLLFTELENRENPILVAFDTFDQADEEIRSWISQAFLVRVTNSQNVRVLIAGKNVPDHTEGLEWSECCSPVELRGILEAEYWLPVIESLGRRLPTSAEVGGMMNPLDWFRGICSFLEGNPREIRQAIELKLPKL